MAQKLNIRCSMVLCLFVCGVCRVRLIRYLPHPANMLHHVCLLRACLPSTSGSEVTVVMSAPRSHFLSLSHGCCRTCIPHLAEMWTTLYRPLEKHKFKEIMTTDSLMEDSGIHSLGILPNERQINVPRWVRNLRAPSVHG